MLWRLMQSQIIGHQVFYTSDDIIIKTIKSILPDIAAMILTVVFSISFIYLFGHLPDGQVFAASVFGVIFSFWFSHYLVDKMR